MRIDTAIIIINILLALSVFIMALAIYKTPTCTIDDIQTAMAGLQVEVIGDYE